MPSEKMPFKPMLATAIPTDQLSSLRFPLYASVKLDGIRATLQNGVLLSRSLKPIPNEYIQKAFRQMPLEGADGELIFGDPAAKDCFRQTESIVMSDDKPAGGIEYHIFDLKSDRGFADRYLTLCDAFEKLHNEFAITLVLQQYCYTVCEVTQFEEDALEVGYEGVMLRSPDGPYKSGRATLRSQDLLKLKRFEDSEAEILGVQEEMENTNAEFTNELGRTARSSHKAGKVGKGTLGALLVRDLKTKVEFAIGTGFDAAARSALWSQRAELVGKLVKYKYFPTGSKDKPRFPVFLGFRDKRDM